MTDFKQPEVIPVRVSVCIVSWNTVGPLRACLEALQADKPTADIEIIVVDNASSDGSVAMVRQGFPAVRLLPQSENLMFGPGANVAAATALGQYVLILNSDTEVLPSQVRAMADYMDASSQVGACSPREKNASGKRWPLVQPLPSPGRLLVKTLGGRRFTRRAQSEEGRQEWLSGSCMMVRREVAEQVGYFDPGYHFYFEDADFCARIREAGYELRVVPGVTTVHQHAASSRKVDRGQRWVWLTEGTCRYLWKHHSSASARATILIATLEALRNAAAYALGTALTLGQSRALRQRARVGPKVVGILVRAVRGQKGSRLSGPAVGVRELRSRSSRSGGADPV